eukprot:3375936-Ditylum_brightwellii.AAC.1
MRDFYQRARNKVHYLFLFHPFENPAPCQSLVLAACMPSTVFPEQLHLGGHVLAQVGAFVGSVLILSGFGDSRCPIRANEET